MIWHRAVALLPASVRSESARMQISPKKPQPQLKLRPGCTAAVGFWFGSSTPHRAMSANFWARLNGDGASLRRFSGAAWSVVGRRRPILDWRTLMVDLRHVVRSGTATERYFGCNPSAGGRHKWPRRRGNTRRDVRSRPLWTTHCVLRCTEVEPDCQNRCVPPIVAGGGQSWCGQALEDGGGGAGQLRVALSRRVRRVRTTRWTVVGRSRESTMTATGYRLPL